MDRSRTYPIPIDEQLVRPSLTINHHLSTFPYISHPSISHQSTEKNRNTELAGRTHTVR